MQVGLELSIPPELPVPEYKSQVAVVGGRGEVPGSMVRA